MVGREFTYAHEAPEPAHDHTVLEVRGLGRRGVFADVDFTVDAGEVLGIAGLVGAGRTETVRCIAGADRADAGEVFVDGKKINAQNPRAAIKAGIVMVPEDRKGQGLNLDRSASENVTFPWERCWPGPASSRAASCGRRARSCRASSTSAVAWACR
jgi:ribose transport system ATP-binding protein